MSLVVVGAVALDSVETPSQKRDNLLGGSGAYFSYAASFFTPVRLLSVVGDDWPPEHTELLNSRNIDTTGLQVVAGAKTWQAGTKNIIKKLYLFLLVHCVLRT